MTKLFTRSGAEYSGNVQFNAKGKPTYTYDVACTRCHVINGQRLYVMGMLNGQPYSRTGFDCYACGNTGVISTKTAPLYTAEKLAKLNAASDKRDAAKSAKLAAIQAEHQAAKDAFVEMHKPFFDTLDGLTGEFWQRLRNDMTNRMKTPTERQIELVNGEVAKRQQNATSTHIGTIGERVEIVGTIERIITTENFYGIKHINIIRCNNGNVVVYRGNYLGGKDDSIHIMATITEHGEHNGTKQTIVQRPKII
jgi:hypothetical protein